MYFSSAPGCACSHRRVAAAQDADVLADVADLQQARLHAVVQVGREVGDLVGEVDDLRLQRRPLAEKIFGQLRMLRRAVVARVLDDAFARAQRQVQPAVARVALLEALDDAQRMQVVVEAQAVTLQAVVQRALAGVPERRMPDVVHQRQRLGQIDIQSERAGDVARNLRDLDRVRQAAAKVVRGAAGEDLRLARQPAKRARLHDAVAVALERACGRRRQARERRAPRAHAPLRRRLHRTAGCQSCRCSTAASTAARTTSQAVAPSMRQLHARAFELVLHCATSAGSASGGSDVAYCASDAATPASPAAACRSSRTISPRWSSTVGSLSPLRSDRLAHVVLRQRVLPCL